MFSVSEPLGQDAAAVDPAKVAQFVRHFQYIDDPKKGLEEVVVFAERAAQRMMTSGPVSAQAQMDAYNAAIAGYFTAYGDDLNIEGMFPALTDRLTKAKAGIAEGLRLASGGAGSEVFITGKGGAEDIEVIPGARIDAARAAASNGQPSGIGTGVIALGAAALVTWLALR